MGAWGEESGSNFKFQKLLQIQFNMEEKEKLPTHTITPVTFKNSVGDDLSGELVLTPHAPKDAYVTIICHGLDCTKDTGFYPLLSASLPTPSFRFSFRGCGASTGEPTGAQARTHICTHAHMHEGVVAGSSAECRSILHCSASTPSHL